MKQKKKIGLFRNDSKGKLVRKPSGIFWASVNHSGTVYFHSTHTKDAEKARVILDQFRLSVMADSSDGKEVVK